MIRAAVFTLPVGLVGFDAEPVLTALDQPHRRQLATNIIRSAFAGYAGQTLLDLACSNGPDAERLERFVPDPYADDVTVVVNAEDLRLFLRSREPGLVELFERELREGIGMQRVTTMAIRTWDER